jgi:hypothetical protein
MPNLLDVSWWRFGGIIGAIVPMTLLLIFKILSYCNICFGDHLLSSLLIFAIALLQRPVVILGRALNLPIETGGPAFIMYELNFFGWSLVILAWGFAGAIVSGVAHGLLAVSSNWLKAPLQ